MEKHFLTKLENKHIESGKNDASQQEEQKGRRWVKLPENKRVDRNWESYEMDK